ncbi:acyltransferase family protein [Shewanella donghaensis]|uniref:acyltransferase family protein n=1 Tax=Shewanella donghaensis TaxID=238836 RepID=UPI00131557FE|nr:acyltransferase family protein [Shewanella donghaensis]
MSKNRISWMGIARLFVPNQDDMPSRRYDLDWLRILVFGLLILFHSGMFYVENWGYHAKSQYQSQFLENIMLIVEPWRMAVLWVISGIAIRFVLAKVSMWRFISMRSFRLLLPLLFGVLVVVPPQLYVEMSYNGDLNLSYWQFLSEFYSPNSAVFEQYQSGIWPHIDVNHLWFIRSLWQFSLILLCLLPLLNSQWVSLATTWLFTRHGVLAVILAVLPLFIIQINWDMDTVRYPLGFTFMVYGYLIGWNSIFWQRVSELIQPLFFASVCCYIASIAFYNLVWLKLSEGGQSENPVILLLGMFNYSLMRVLGALTVFSLAYKYLNKPSANLRYFNDAVYPFYILHQTFILVIGYQLSSMNLGSIIEPILLIIFTVLACFFAYELIRRVDLFRPLFGLKMKGDYQIVSQRIGYIMAILLIIPIGLQITL